MRFRLRDTRFGLSEIDLAVSDQGELIVKCNCPPGRVGRMCKHQRAVRAGDLTVLHELADWEAAMAFLADAECASQAREDPDLSLQLATLEGEGGNQQTQADTQR